MIVSAFQTAFDTEDDSAFARLCSQHDQPVVRQDEDPFTFANDININLRAQYAGLRANSAAPHSALAVRVQEARDSLRQLKQAAGGAGEVQHFSMLHFDSATTVKNNAVKHNAIEIAKSDTSEIDMPFRKQFPDTEPPFEKSFMDKMSVFLGFNDDTEVSTELLRPGLFLKFPRE
ncbi:hypothetical protein CYMTET_42979 [Cymbomonas tetramitiformis]|uniref:Uncharacterized protein n=1 Tax=Cymbomonas tetramitiformis TaxID=36881 RepID=A0AAE0C340_9CHLO|nr:hypothetical protein CYMTET_42979 [Cymbomonas tetramitiformis]